MRLPQPDPMNRVVPTLARSLHLTVFATLAACTFGTGWTTWRQEVAERKVAIDVTIAPAEELGLRSEYGSIEVRAGTGPARVEATLHATAPTVEEAERILSECSIATRREAGRVVVELHEPDLGPHRSVTASYRALVPEGVAVHAETATGDVTVLGGVGDCNLRTGYGSVRAEGARGSVVARSSTGNIAFGSVSGARMVLETHYGNVVAHDVDAERIDCEAGTGSIEVLRSPGAILHLRTAYGDVVVRESSGELDLATNTGAVLVRDFDGRVVARSGYGTIEIAGGLRALAVRAGTGDVRVEASEGSACDSGWEIRSDYGNLTVMLPAGIDARIHASTDYGNVVSELPLNDTRVAGRAVEGSLGAGAGSVRVHTGTGEVVLRRR